MVYEQIEFEEKIKSLSHHKNPHIYYRQLKEELEKLDLEFKEKLVGLLEEVYDNYEREMDNLLLRAIYGD